MHVHDPSNAKTETLSHFHGLSLGDFAIDGVEFEFRLDGHIELQDGSHGYREDGLQTHVPFSKGHANGNLESEDAMKVGAARGTAERGRLFGGCRSVCQR